ncbi:hypothetical protein G7Y89_g11415 [Cudoniella acicularis]|uniref:Uncharacterized protein n=1 Tax=Cudoniella acicularis TaxID=354080 RepID=A0A8H4VYB1_9HELO|nr:hypothetical protein G7Y89_g11415 [Cudoniella acicularis]
MGSKHIPAKVCIGKEAGDRDIGRWALALGQKCPCAAVRFTIPAMESKAFERQFEMSGPLPCTSATPTGPGVESGPLAGASSEPSPALGSPDPPYSSESSLQVPPPPQFAPLQAKMAFREAAKSATSNASSYSPGCLGSSGCKAHSAPPRTPNPARHVTAVNHCSRLKLLACSCFWV